MKNHTVFNHSIGITYNHLGSVFEKKGDYYRAIEYYEQSLSIDIELMGHQHPSTAASYNNLGNVYKKLNDHSQAKLFYNKSYTVFHNVFGDLHPHTTLLKTKLDDLNDL